MKNITICILLLFFTSCKYNSDSINPVARVLDHELYKHAIPKFNNDILKDSVLFIHDFIHEWAIQKLLINKAEFNFKKDPSYIDSLVNVYRESLLIHYYKQALIQTYLDTMINDSLVRNYYIEHTDHFVLQEDIVMLNYIKIRSVAPDLEFVSNRYYSNNASDLDQLKDYCFQFADRFFLDDMIWISFSDFKKQLPIEYKYENHSFFFRKNKKVELEDENYKYFIFIKDFRLKGESSPLEYVSSSIRKILINKRKKDIIYSVEEKLIQEAIENNNFEIYE